MFVIYPYVYKKLSYDPFADFTPVTRVCKFPFAVSVGPAVPASVKTLADYMRWCAANPAQALYGIAAAGSGTHFGGVMLSRASGVPLTSVPYKGGAPAVQDLMGGQVPATVNVLGEILPYLGSGKVRILATTGAARSRLTPDVPTVGETFPGYVAEEWFGAFTSRKAPADRVAKLAAAIQEALKAQAVVQGYEKLGFEVAGESGPAFEAIIKAEVQRAISADEDAIKRLCANYIENVRACFKERATVGDGGFKGGVLAGLDADVGDFENHGRAF